MNKTFNAILISTIALCGVACSEAVDEAERTYDCSKICDAYSDCYDDDLDKSACVDSCEANGDADPDFEEQASECEECIDDSSCVEATLDCANECTTVVSESTD
jgi:hypothetical protein